MISAEEGERIPNQSSRKHAELLDTLASHQTTVVDLLKETSKRHGAFNKALDELIGIDFLALAAPAPAVHEPAK